MNWNEYTKKALSTSTHATREKRISCCLFGLFGETWEYLEKKGLNAPEEELKQEMGDRFWYLSILSLSCFFLVPSITFRLSGLLLIL